MLGSLKQYTAQSFKYLWTLIEKLKWAPHRRIKLSFQVAECCKKHAPVVLLLKVSQVSNSTYAGYPIGGLNFPIKVAELNFISSLLPLELADLLRDLFTRS